MPQRITFTIQGEIYFLAGFADRTRASTVSLYAMTRPLDRVPVEMFYVDLPLYSHPLCKTLTQPRYNVGIYDYPGPGLGTAKLLVLDWRVVNNSGTTQPLYGYFMVDDTRRVMLIATGNILNTTIPDGGHVDVSYELWSRGSPSGVP